MSTNQPHLDVLWPVVWYPEIETGVSTCLPLRGPRPRRSGSRDMYPLTNVTPVHHTPLAPIRRPLPSSPSPSSPLQSGTTVVMVVVTVAVTVVVVVVMVNNSTHTHTHTIGAPAPAVPPPTPPPCALSNAIMYAISRLFRSFLHYMKYKENRLFSSYIEQLKVTIARATHTQVRQNK